MRYTLENDQLALTVDSLGAEIVDVIDKSIGAQMSWPGDPQVWPRRAPILWPYVGSLWNGEYRLDGKIYKGNLHGFARDLEFERIDGVEDCLEFCLCWNEKTLELFPRRFCIVIRFTLSGRTVHQQVQVENPDSRELRFGFGYHPGFVIPFDDKHQTQDYELRFDTPQTPEVVEVENGYVTGKTHLLMENSCVIPMTDRMFDGGSICMKGLQAKTLSLVEKDSDRKITMDIEGFPYTLIWSMPGTPNLRFICLEPWHNLQDTVNADGDWNAKPCAAVLLPGECWESNLKITFDR